MAEVHWLDLLIHFIVWPIFLLFCRYAYFLWRYWKILGLYRGGESLITIKLRFLCVFRISCVEAGGQIWEGKSYKINDEGNYLTGLYVWNPNQKERSDIGRHYLYFLGDRKNITVEWQNLITVSEHKGLSNWGKVK